jgi:cyclic beta-1,2-glucan synthetase
MRRHPLFGPTHLCGGIAAAPPRSGVRTWYTGSAAWAWRLGVEAILGLRLRAGRLEIDPRIPRTWGGFEAELAGPAGRLAVRVEDPDAVGTGVVTIDVDGATIDGVIVEFPTDGSIRHVSVRLGRDVRAASGRDAPDSSTPRRYAP